MQIKQRTSGTIRKLATTILTQDHCQELSRAAMDTQKRIKKKKCEMPLLRKKKVKPRKL